MGYVFIPVVTLFLVLLVVNDHWPLRSLFNRDEPIPDDEIDAIVRETVEGMQQATKDSKSKVWDW